MTVYLLYIPTFMFPLFQHIVINSYIITNKLLHWFVILVKELNYIFYVFLFVIVSNK